MGTLSVVGLGPGDPGLLPPACLAALTEADAVFLRTERHPVASLLAARGLGWTSFDRLLRRGAGYEELPGEMAARVVTAARAAGPEGRVAYAVPGDPGMGEAVTRRVLALARAGGLPVRVLAAPALPGPVPDGPDLDPAQGLQVLDVLELGGVAPRLAVGLLVLHVDSPELLSHARRSLAGHYPAGHRVLLLGAGAGGATGLPLDELERARLPEAPAALYLPPLGAAAAEAGVGRFVRVVERLRAPGGCPWDRRQTHESLRPYVVEEAYEVVEAIEAGDPARLAEELGDLLLQVVLHSVIAAEAGRFDLRDVVDAITRKIVRRHPHVFGGAAGGGETPQWEAIKRQEREEREEQEGRPPGVLKERGASVPALLEAEDLQSQASGVGFDWPSAAEAWPKVEEEAGEFRRAWERGDRAAMEEELGDLLFALANVARLLDLPAELALKGCNRKFARRLRRMEELAREEGRSLAGMTLAELDRIWDRVKEAEQPGRARAENR